MPRLYPQQLTQLLFGKPQTSYVHCGLGTIEAVRDRQRLALLQGQGKPLERFVITRAPHCLRGSLQRRRAGDCRAVGAGPIDEPAHHAQPQQDRDAYPYQTPSTPGRFCRLRTHHQESSAEETEDVALRDQGCWREERV